MPDSTRGQSGLDRLLAFVVVAVVLVAVLPTVLGVAGIDVRQDDGVAAEQPTPTPEPASLQVLNVSGTTGPENRSVEAVRITLTKVGSSAPVDAAALTATWADQGTYYLTAGQQEERSDGAFGVSVTHVSDADGLVLAETGDRATLTFDVGADDVADVPAFGSALAAGESADIILATADGETTTVSVEVPDSLAGKRVVGL
ncbi:MULTISPECIES: hypothetical protein [Salinibaculum]|uniref:hypothetical protein n=1 Tax=Salinibaculum TaxID=2732368 RepID=UPI0030D55EC3